MVLEGINELNIVDLGTMGKDSIYRITTDDVGNWGLLTIR